MDVPVMDYVAAIKQGDLEKAAELSFDCIQCGLCATRCMAEMAQYHIAQMVRRIRGKFLAPHSDHCDEQVEAIRSGYYDSFIEELKALGSIDPSNPDVIGDGIVKLKELYNQRQMESHQAPDDWTPDSDYALLRK